MNKVDIVDLYWNAMRSWDVNKYSNRFLVTVYLVSSYMYYHLDTNILCDTDYDQLCKLLLDRWDEIAKDEYIWNHKILDKELLVAGSGFSILEDSYPQILRDLAKQLALRAGNEKKLEAIEEFKNVG